MRYEGMIYRPPGEWKSYLLQVTVGCSHNACTFCGMYKDKRFHVRPMADVLEDIRMAQDHYGDVRRVFLCDGDATTIPTEELCHILDALYGAFPSLEKVTSYAGPRGILQKPPKEWTALYAHGLKRVYLGVETGSDALLKQICKGVTAEEMCQAGIRVREAGLDLWVMVILGLAGAGKGAEHMAHTVELMNRMRPRHLSALSLMLEEGTPLWRDWQAGRFIPAGPEELLKEARQLIAGLEVEPLHFTCDHASNYLPLKGSLPRQREEFLQRIDQALGGERSLRPEWSRGI